MTGMLTLNPPPVLCAYCERPAVVQRTRGPWTAPLCVPDMRAFQEELWDSPARLRWLTTRILPQAMKVSQ